MGWVRGQTGEQKEERKAKTARGWGGGGCLGRKTWAGLGEGVGGLRSLGVGEEDPVGDHAAARLRTFQGG